VTPADLCRKWRQKAEALVNSNDRDPKVAGVAAKAYEECAESLARALGGTPRQMQVTQPPTPRAIPREEA
jgi:hypothetical protein